MELRIEPLCPKLVVVDGDPIEREAMRRTLQHQSWQTHFAPTANDALQLVLQDRTCVLVSDWQMPGMSGLDLCRALRNQEQHEQDVRTYILLITGQVGSEAVVEALNAGADDFIARPVQASELLARIQSGFRRLTIEHDLRELLAKTRELAVTDPLTQIANRRRGQDVLTAELARVSRDFQELSVILLDIDRFKSINDQQGHDAGDHVLAEVARRIGRSIRVYDLVARWGGDEFLIICPNVSNHDVALVAERTRASIADSPVSLEGDASVSVTVSLGAATVRQGQELDSRELLRQVDSQLYLAKEAGRNCVRVCGE